LGFLSVEGIPISMDKHLVLVGLVIAIIAIVLLGCSITGLLFLEMPMRAANGTNVMVANATGIMNLSGPASFSGNVTDQDGHAVQGALISIIGDNSNYSGISDAEGDFDITGMENGTYSISIEKKDYTGIRFDWTFKNGDRFTYSPTITDLCPVSLANSSIAYTMITRDSGTMERGSMTITFPYPDGSSYRIYPPVDGVTSSVDTRYLEGNSVIDMTINDDNGLPLPFELEVVYNGTETWKAYQDTGMSISDAGNAQPDYFGTISDPISKKVLVDPYDPEIAAIASEVKNETGSNDTWVVAKALFSWLMRNTTYYSSITNSGPTYQYQSAIEVLDSGRGECEELSSLYISLLRSVGIPAREVGGYYMTPDGENATATGHEWVEFYDGDWVPVDVSGAGNDWNDQLTNEFGMQAPLYLTTIIDNTGINSSFDFLGIHTASAIDSPDLNISDDTFFRQYTLKPFNPEHVEFCQNGTIILNVSNS